MGQDHSHSDLKGKNLFLSILLNIVITASQVIGGLISGSLALLSDALHNFSDVISLIVSYAANRLAKKEASLYRTFGYKRAEILAAFINASTLIIVAILLIIEAIKRFQNPKDIESNLVIWMSVLGIVANGLSVLLLKKDSEANMNMKSAYLHLFTDMMASVAVLVGGLLMKYFQIYWVDSVLTLVIALYLIWMGFDLLVNSTKVLMLFTPDHVHVWQLNEDEIHLEAHIDFTEDITLSKFDSILHEIEDLVFSKYDINHVNIQPEFGKNDIKDVIVQD